MFRGFGKLHARSLLQKQAQLTELEEQLDELDKSDAKVRETRWKLHSHINTPDADNEERKNLIDKIDLHMKEYGLCFSYLMERIQGLIEVARRSALALQPDLRFT
jgi:hypothetical protein